ncbi:MAG: CPBP family intramembrane metalloprotease [Lachnospiraceae bacterium]|nr:CPBP family intramembrane metalloprotease [Lachnospiraceae bacterium]
MKFLKGLGWFFMSTLPFAAAFLLMVVVGVIVLIFGLDENGIIFGSHLAMAAAFGLWYYLACVHPNKHLPKKEGRIITAPVVGWAIATGIMLCLFNTQLVKVGEYFVPHIVMEFYEAMEEAGFNDNFYAIGAAVLLAPLGEEFLCRGVIHHYAAKISKHFWVGNMIQALLFGILHMQLVQGTYAFIIGLVFGWLRYRYGTILVPILVHFVVNFSTASWLGILLSGVPAKMMLDIGLLALAIGGTAWILILIGKKEEEPVTTCHSEPQAKNLR